MTRLYTDEQLADIARPFEDQRQRRSNAAMSRASGELLAAMKSGPAGSTACRGPHCRARPARCDRTSAEKQAREELARLGAQADAHMDAAIRARR